jgi:hypothetical protein
MKRLREEIQDTLRFINPCVGADSVDVQEDWMTISKKAFAPRGKDVPLVNWIHGDGRDPEDPKPEPVDLSVNGLLANLEKLKAERTEWKTQLNKPHATSSGSAQSRVIHALVDELAREVAKREKQCPLKVGDHYQLDRLESIQKLGRCLSEINTRAAASSLHGNESKGYILECLEKELVTFNTEKRQVVSLAPPPSPHLSAAANLKLTGRMWKTKAAAIRTEKIEVYSGKSELAAEESIEKWLCSVGITKEEAAKYTQGLVRLGFNTMYLMLSVAERDLEEVGMKKGHRRRVLKKLATDEAAYVQPDKFNQPPAKPQGHPLSSPKGTPAQQMGIEEWLYSVGIPAGDAAKYTQRLEEDGFDNMKILIRTVEEDDLDDINMQKAHQRIVLKIVRELKSCGTSTPRGGTPTARVPLDKY